MLKLAILFSAALAVLQSVVNAGVLPPGFEKMEGQCSGGAAVPPWARCLPLDGSWPARVFRVAPDDQQRNDTITLRQAQPNAKNGGRLFWIEGGVYDYDGFEVYAQYGYSSLSKINVYRCVPGARCIVRTSFRGYAGNNWVWGVEFSDPEGKLSTSGNAQVQLYGFNTVAINLYVHSSRGPPSGIITRGNPSDNSVTWGPPLLAQGISTYSVYGCWLSSLGWGSTGGKSGLLRLISKVDAWGPTHAADNVMMNQRAVCVDCGCIWSADGNVANSGIQLHRNIFVNGRLTIGDMAEPIYRTVLEDSILIDSDAILFQRGRPFQANITGNSFVRSAVFDCEHLGAGASEFARPPAFVVKNNRFLVAPEGSFYAGTRRYYTLRTGVVPPGGTVGATLETGPLDASDSFDGNAYFGNFSVALGATSNAPVDLNADRCEGSVEYSSLASWSDATAAAGNRADASSTHNGNPPSGLEVHVHPNWFEHTRANIHVMNWNMEATLAQVDISTALLGQSWAIYAGLCPFSTPLRAGSSYTAGSVTLSVANQEQATFLLAPPWSSQGLVQADPLVNTMPAAITGVSPSSGIPRTGGTLLRIYGDGFVCSDLLRVRIGDFVAQAAWVSASELAVLAPQMQGGNYARHWTSEKTASISVSNNCGAWLHSALNITYDSAAAALPWNPGMLPSVGTRCLAQGRVAADGATLAPTAVPAPTSAPVSSSASRIKWFGFL